MNFADLKRNANQEFLKHFKFYFILFLPYLILQSINGLLSNQLTSDLSAALINGSDEIQNYLSQNQMAVNLSYLLSAIMAIVVAGIAFQVLDIIRNKANHERPFEKSTALFGNPMILGIIGTVILEIIFLTLWAFLFIVPAVIKFYSYSQAIYIYRDAYVSGERISPLQAITQSRQLMAGHKGELFLLKLSFIGWWILLSISLSFTIIPILGIFIYPYYEITMMNYYNQLRA